MIFKGFKGSLTVKIISIVLVFAFSTYNISFATVEKDKGAPHAAEENKPLMADEVAIAIDAGTIKSKYQGDSGKIVVHIQDAHCNFEAQSNINRMLDQLFKEANIEMISVEGAEGIVDTAWFKAFPDAEIRKEVATYFMKKGEITGAEYFSINSDYNGTIFGAETKDYYIKNLKAFTDVYPYKQAIERYFTDTKQIATRLKSIIYPKNLKKLDSNIEAFENKELELSEFAGYLYRTSQKKKVDLSDAPNFKKLIDTLEYENKIDFDIVDSERAKYIDVLAKKLDKKKMTELVAQSIRFKKGHIKAVDFYSYLRDIAKEEKIDMLREYPNLFYYYIYTKIYDGIDNEGLFREIDTVERRLKNSMFTDSLQKQLDEYSEMVDMFVDLVNIELTNEDYERFQEYFKRFSLEDVIVFYNQLIDKYNLNYSLGTIPLEINENIPRMISFYEIAMKRDEALIDNTLNRMDEEGKDRCVLIAGGFHTKGMKALLEEKGVSYVVVTPKITKDVETPYIKVLTNQRTSLEDIITESAAMPGTDIRTSKEKMEENISDLLSPLLRFGYGITMYLDPEEKETLRKLSEQMGSIEGLPSFMGATVTTFEEAIELLTTGWIETIKEAMTKAESEERFEEFLADDNLWGMLQSVHLAKYDDYFAATEAKTLPSEEVRNRIKAAFEKFRGGGLTPGIQAAGRVLTPKQASDFGEVLADKFKEREAMTEEERQAHEIRRDEVRPGLVIQLHDGLVEALYAKDPLLPANVHPGRGGKVLLEKIGRKGLQIHIDTQFYNSLTEEERETLIRHELAHLDLVNLEELYNEISAGFEAAAFVNYSANDIAEEVKKSLHDDDERGSPFGIYGADISDTDGIQSRIDQILLLLDEWRKSGYFTGENQESFVNETLGYDVTAIEEKFKVLADERKKVMLAKEGNVDDLEAIVESNEGVSEVIAITNGGDGKIVQNNLEGLKDAIFRKDGKVTVMAHEEVTRRGQFLGLLDAMKEWKKQHGDFNRDGVSLGIMMPGKGTRLSPLTLRLHGIKPFITMLIKATGKLLSGATASLYTWNLVANTLKEKGFRGIAWKWGDEPQIAAKRLSELDIDLNGTDIIRFGSKVLVTDDLAENKEWLNAEEDGTFVAQVRRRGRPELLKALGVEDTKDAKAMVHIGSPAFSYDFIDAAIEAFQDVPQEKWIDVDGYLIEALTLKRDADLTEKERKEGIRTWDSELREEERVGATGMKEVLENVPDFYERAQELKRILNEKKGQPADAPINIKVIDFGEELAWFDVGQLPKARESFYGVNRNTPEGNFARRVAGMEDAKVDEFGNRIVGECYYPKDGSIRNSTLINAMILGDEVDINGAVIVDSELGNATIGRESVVYESTVPNLVMGEKAFAFMSVAEKSLTVPTDTVHTSMPSDPLDLERIKREGLEDWRAETVDAEGKDINVGKGAFYDEPAFGNPRSFNEQREIMRVRSDEVTIDEIESTIKQYVRKPIYSREVIKPIITRVVTQIAARDREGLDKVLAELDSRGAILPIWSDLTAYLNQLNKNTPRSKLRTEIVYFCNMILLKYGTMELKQLAQTEKDLLMSQSEGTTIDPNIFRRDSIRAVAETQLPDNVVFASGVAYAELIAEMRGVSTEEVTITLGRESRESGERIINMFKRGIVSTGARVIDATDEGKVKTSTPLIYFASRYLLDNQKKEVDGNVNITASHLQGEWNGLKPMLVYANFTADQMDEWLARTHDAIDRGVDPRDFPEELKEQTDTASLLEPYHVHLVAALQGSDEWLGYVEAVQRGEMTLQEALAKIKPRVDEYIATQPLKGLKIAGDSAFGSMGPIVTPLFMALGAEYEDIGAIADYTLATHDANPNNPDNLQMLIQKVSSMDASFGTGFDVDGDRLGVVTRDSQILRGDDISTIIAPIVIREAIQKAERAGRKGYQPVVVMNVLCSDRLKTAVEKAGGKLIESAVGFNKVKEVMDEHDAIMGVEISSHIMFKENFNADDALFAVVKLLSVLRDRVAEYKERGEETPANLIDVMLDETNERLGIEQDFHTGEWRTRMVSDEARVEVADRIKAHYVEQAEVNPDRYRIRNELDGLKVDFLREGEAVGFLAVRPSGTSPEMVVAVNSIVSEKDFDEIKQDFLSQLVNYKEYVLLDKLEPNKYKEDLARFTSLQETPRGAEEADVTPDGVIPGEERLTPGVYAATPRENLQEIDRIPLYKGKGVVPNIIERGKHTEEVVLYRRPKAEGEIEGEIVVQDRMELITSEPVEVPELLTAEEARSVRVTVEGRSPVEIDNKEFKPDEMREITLKEPTLKRAKKTVVNERAQVLVDRELSEREREGYESLAQIRKALRTVTGMKARIHVPKEMFYESVDDDDVGTVKWTEEILQKIVGEDNTVELLPYTASVGLADLERRQIDPQETEVVDVLIAADVHLAEIEPGKIEQFVERARVLAIPAKALEFKNGWDANLETTGWGTVVAAINPENIAKTADETSPASIFYDFLTRVLKKTERNERGEVIRLKRERLYGFLPYNKIEGYLDSITDKALLADLKGGVISRMAMLINNMLFNMKMEPFKPGEAFRSKLAVLWSA